MIIDTNIIISLARERHKKIDGLATAFMRRHTNEKKFVTQTIIGEFSCGASVNSKEILSKVMLPYTVLPLNHEVSWQYSQIYKKLAVQGKLIGVNDMWIAAAGLAYDVPVATGNLREFQRVEGLEVIPLEEA